MLHGAFNEHEVLARSLARYLRTSPAPARVVIFGMESHATFIDEALKATSSFRARLGVAWGAAATTNPCFGIVRNHGATPYRALGRKLSVEQLATEVSLATNMTAQAIFNESRCLQIAPRGSHYSKTSKAHCDTFIRTSNALIKSVHTLTLAYLLQPFVGQLAKRILVDTSAIASVVYAACHIAIQSGALTEMPTIDSFQSYEGLSDADLEDIENTLFVISASTSGNLARKAFLKGVKRHQLKTLYLLSKEQLDQEALCLLGKHEGNPDGVELLKSWDENNCSLCRKGSAPIQIGGDLFLTALPETVSVSLVKSHLSGDQRNIISRFAGLGVFRVHRRIGDRTTEISIDLESAFATTLNTPGVTEFREEWQRLLRRHVPANMTHLVYPDYPFAPMMAEGINSFSLQYVIPKFSVTSGNDLISSPIVKDGCAVVVTPCADDPIELMGINRDLRTKIPGGSATYLFPFLRAQSEAQAKGMITNLTFGDRGAGTYSLYSMYNIYLPDDRTTNPWDRELSCLKALGDWIEEKEGEVPVELTTRCKQLSEATANGLTDNLFWPDSTGKALRIRTNFVLLPTKDGTRPLDQVDIFVVVSALLNNVRQLEGSNSLRSSQYQRKVLAPSNFVRFNDGVIQAALLRAAHNGELNYVATEDGVYSASMTDHILKMVDKAASEDGEALTEFLFAIATGTLRLEERDLRWIIRTILNGQEKVPTIVASLARGIEAGVLPPS